MPRVLFLVPAQYENAYQFLAVAQDLRKYYYGPENSIIFQMVWNGTENTDPTFQLASGVATGFSKSFWASLDASDLFMPICHCGLRDGPMIGPDGQQPWHTVDEAGFTLTDYSVQFWRRISWSVGSGGKILLAGCDTGAMYGPLVAKVMPTVEVWGFKQHVMLGYIDKGRDLIGDGFMKGRSKGGLRKC